VRLNGGVTDRPDKWLVLAAGVRLGYEDDVPVALVGVAVEHKASQLAAAGVLDLPPHQVLGEGVDAAVLLAGADGARATVTGSAQQLALAAVFEDRVQRAAPLCNPRREADNPPVVVHAVIIIDTAARSGSGPLGVRSARRPSAQAPPVGRARDVR
jgi:hypothetical protein